MGEEKLVYFYDKVKLARSLTVLRPRFHKLSKVKERRYAAVVQGPGSEAFLKMCFKH